MKKERIMNTSAVEDGREEYRIQLSFYVFQEHGTYIAYCPSLDISTSGESFNEAVGNFHECFRLHVECCAASGTLQADLLSHGWRVQKKEIQPPTFSSLMKKREMKELMEGCLSFERMVTPARLPSLA